MKMTERAATADGWSEDIRWEDICRACMRPGAFKLRALIEKQIKAGKVRQTARGRYQFRTEPMKEETS
jgi:hypothetical protein